MAGLLTKSPSKRLAWPDLEEHPFLKDYENVHGIPFRPNTAPLAGRLPSRAATMTPPPVTPSSHPPTREAVVHKSQQQLLPIKGV